jgi:metallo-beta-lactamase family protein
MATLSFYGATGTTTGSKYLLEHNGFRLMVDCGLYQGLKELRLRNWEGPPIEPSALDLIVLTHGHIDHSGYLPLMVARGFEGKTLATDATCDLLGILLPDSGYLQEEDARWANKRGYSKHKPALPLYTEEQARRSLASLRPVPFDKTVTVHDDIKIRFYPAGHILGASFIEFHFREGDGSEKTIVFSGDMGRLDRPIIPDPAPLPHCDHLVMESTYGNRDHSGEDPKDHLASIIEETVRGGGSVVIPAFAIGRTQALLFLLRELQREDRLPRDIPIHVDSPMAIHAIRVFMKHREAHDLEMRAMVAKGEDPLGLQGVHLNTTVEQSKALNSLNYPAIIISASGMASGGRILHHLAYRLPDHRTTVLFTGYQAAGTRGRALQEGAKRIKIHGRQVVVRARVEALGGLSAHADRNGLLEWLRSSSPPPKNVHLTHGEPESTEALAGFLKERTGIDAHIPVYKERIEI